MLLTRFCLESEIFAIIFLFTFGITLLQLFRNSEGRFELLLACLSILVSGKIPLQIYPPVPSHL